MNRRIYLRMKSLKEAKEIWTEAINRGSRLTELIPVQDSLSRVTSEPVIAKTSSPAYHSAAMDGIAVWANNTIGVSEVCPKQLVLGQEAVFLNTGEVLPAGFDAVIKIEEVYISGDRVEIQSSTPPWQHIRMVGEDIVAGELILPINHRIRPQDIAAMLAAGITKLRVQKQVQVVIIPTGKELIQPGEELKPGQIIEFNSYFISSMISEWGGDTHVTEIIPDDPKRLREQIIQVSEAELVIILSGSSAGSEDYTPGVIEELGQLLVHGVTMMPGKPVALGIINGKPVIGLPGYSVSAWLCAQEFVKPVILKLSGLPVTKPKTIKAIISQKLPSKLGLEEFIRVNIGCFKPEKEANEQFIALPQKQGAGVITSLVKADGILRIPSLSEGIAVDSTIEIELLRDESEIRNNIILIGSHDNSLDILQDELKSQHTELNLSIINVGSLGGLMALKRRHTHLSTCHLLDEETGEYNTPYIRRILYNIEVVLINLVYRQQGLIVARGNPKGIKGITDLFRKDICFVNRQAGSGTRVLLDYELKKARLEPEEIQGYTTEVFTHMALAAVVGSGGADVGLGIMAAAKAMNLDFVPVAQEQYDLVIPDIYYQTPRIQCLLEIINSKRFKERVAALGGYDISDCGRIQERIDDDKKDTVRNN